MALGKLEKNRKARNELLWNSLTDTSMPARHLTFSFLQMLNSGRVWMLAAGKKEVKQGKARTAAAQPGKRFPADLAFLESQATSQYFSSLQR